MRILTLGGTVPTLTSPRRACWVGIEPAALAPLRRAGLTVLGRECESLPELQAVVDQLKSELDDMIREARF